MQREFEDYLKCGRLEHGFLRVGCESCHAEHLVAFSCKRRGFCPSCGARRMAETAALLVDEVFPEAPVRQSVLSVPDALRLVFATRPAIMEDDAASAPIPAGARNYITPAGYKRLKDGALHLLDKERPELVKVIQWAAANGDRSENADYIYGKRRLREIDRRIRFLTKRLDLAEVVDPAARDAGTEQVFFGATVILADARGVQSTYTIVGIDEADASRGRISWISPLARGLLKRREGDQITFKAPGGDQVLDIVSVEYQPLG